MDYKDLCEKTIEVVRSVGETIRDERKKLVLSSIESKGLHNYVTHVDKLAEEQLVSGLEQILPEAGFIAEEGTSTKKGDEFQWIIDPIDGTTNFIHGIPAYSISIALLKGSELVLGVVYEINADEMFYAWKGSKAYLNGIEISVSQETDMHRSLVATGFPYSEYEGVDQYLKILKDFMQETSGVRRLGSAAVDLVYVACGRFESFFEYGLNPWDVAGGAFIVEQAGGEVSDWNGGNKHVFGATILASNKNLHAKNLDIIQRHIDAV